MTRFYQTVPTVLHSKVVSAYTPLPAPHRSGPANPSNAVLWVRDPHDALKDLSELPKQPRHSLLVGSYGAERPGSTYDERYDSPLIRGVDETRPWNLQQEILSRVTTADLVLDIGCGTASRLIPLADFTRGIIGLEPNPSMLTQAAELVVAHHKHNIAIVEGACDELPFHDHAFDVVTGMLAPHNTAEVFRVLKPGGVAILEKLGDRDKWEFTSRFGRDEQGLRARFAHLCPGERAEMYRREFNGLFSSVTIRNEFWTTYYSMEGLILLCQLAPTVRNFDPERDKPILDAIAADLMMERGIRLQQNRILIIAQKAKGPAA